MKKIIPAIVPELEVSDLKKSLKVYTEVFGFTLAFARPEEKFAYLEKGGAHLMLEELAGPGRRFHHVDMEYPFGRGINFQIEVDDVEAVYQKSQKAGLNILIPLEERWYRVDDLEAGNHQFVVFDPDGYVLRFFTDMGSRHFQ